MARGIRKISEAENLKLGDMDVDGYCIHYRRIPNHIRGDIINKHTTIAKRGGEHTNVTAASLEMLEWIVLGWNPGSVIDDADNHVEFAVGEIRWLPDEIQTDILDAAGANMPHDRGDDIKN